jgi:hypothetical protein
MESKIGKYLLESRYTTGHIIVLVCREFPENELSLYSRDTPLATGDRC